MGKGTAQPCKKLPHLLPCANKWGNVLLSLFNNMLIMSHVSGEVKVCSLCKKPKCLSEFHKHNMGRYGINSRCKKCRKQIAHAWYLNNSEKEREKAGEKRRLYKKTKPLWSTWSSMKDRCSNPNNVKYAIYGERGISVCDWWLKYKNFERDMLSTYKKGLTLDRIDGDKGYYKENCRWATPKEQARNMRTNRIIEYNGEKRCLSEWSEVLDIPHSTLWNRLGPLGWSVEKAFTT